VHRETGALSAHPYELTLNEGNEHMEGDAMTLNRTQAFMAGNRCGGGRRRASAQRHA